jgi:hypothetical protein
MAASHFRLGWCNAGAYLLDCHRANGVAPVDGCRPCALLNQPPKTPAPSIWRPWQAPKDGALNVRLGKDPLPEWGERDARKVLAEAYGDNLADAAFKRCAKMAYMGPRGANARYHRRQDYVSIAALQCAETPALRQASPGEVSNAVRNAIVDAERATSLNRRHLTRVNGREQWANSLDTWLMPTQGDDSGNSLFDELTTDIYWRQGYGDPAEWQEQADAQAVDDAKREYLLWRIKTRLGAC